MKIKTSEKLIKEWNKLKKCYKNNMEKEEKYLEECLESLKRLTKEDLLDELEQFLLTKTDKGETLKHLKEHYEKGGLRKQLFNN